MMVPYTFLPVKKPCRFLPTVQVVPYRWFFRGFFMRYLLIIVFASICNMILAATYQVGPTRTYTTLQSVASLVNPGDIVEVDGNQSYQGARFTRNGTLADPITVRGITVNGARPLLNSNASVGATLYTDVLRLEGLHYVIENFEVTGTVSPLTTRGIFIVAHNITIRNCVVHDCPRHGILSADQNSGDHTIEFCEIYNCGNGTTNHQLYLATDNVLYPTATATVRFCYIHDGVGGNSIKSRATRNEILYNWIEGALYHELELIGADPGGQSANVSVREDSQVIGNVILKRSGSSGALVRVGGDGTGESYGRYRFLNNTFIMGGGSTSAIRIFDHIESLEFHNNVFWHGSGSAFTTVRTVEQQGTSADSGQKNWLPTNATGVPASWTGTITGTTPGFVDAVAYNFTPTLDGALYNAGLLPTTSPGGFPFPNPLAAPAYLSPKRVAVAPGSQQGRFSDGQIDIGAIELDTSPVTLSGWAVE